MAQMFKVGIGGASEGQLVAIQLVTEGTELSCATQPEAEVAVRIDLALLGRLTRLFYGGGDRVLVRCPITADVVVWVKLWPALSARDDREILLYSGELNSPADVLAVPSWDHQYVPERGEPFPFRDPHPHRMLNPAAGVIRCRTCTCYVPRGFY
jgi:hypothetical protein